MQKFLVSSYRLITVAIVSVVSIYSTYSPLRTEMRDLLLGRAQQPNQHIDSRSPSRWTQRPAIVNPWSESSSKFKSWQDDLTGEMSWRDVTDNSATSKTSASEASAASFGVTDRERDSDPGLSYTAIIKLAESYVWQGNIDGALTMIDRVADELNGAEIRHLRATIFTMVGRIDEAAEYELLLRLDEQSVFTHVILADMYFKLRNAEFANKHLQLALQYPDLWDAVEHVISTIENERSY